MKVFFMNDSGFDPNKKKDPEEKDLWEYGDSNGESSDRESAPPEGEAPAGSPEPKDETPAGTPEPKDEAPAGSPEPKNEAPAGNPEPKDETPAGNPEPTNETPAGNPEPTNETPAGNPGPTNETPPQQGPYYGPYGGGPYAPNPPPPYGQGRQNGTPCGPAGPRQENPYGQPYYWNYGGPYGPQPPRPPKKMSAGLKAFLWVLGVLAGALIVATGVYGIRASFGRNDASSGTASAPDRGASSSVSSAGSVIGGVKGDGTDPSGTGIKIAPHPSGGELSANTVYKKVIQSVVGVQATIAGAGNQEAGTSEGTGIVASADGYILTNAHVVNDSRSNPVKVILHNNKEYAAKVVGYDKTSDIAVLKINATGLSPAVFGSLDGMEVGDRVIAIGNPGGLGFAGSLTGGYISALDRSIEEHSENGMTYIQTDAAINPGNSGGPLVNLYGQVIGINSNKIIATGYEGMGFAIPVSRAKTIIDDLVAHGYVSGRTRLGISASSVQAAYTQLYGFPQGVLIRQVNSDSDLKNKAVQGDIITKADGTAIASMDDLYAVLNRHKPGDVIKMTIYSTNLSETAGGGKAGSSKEISVRLLEDKGETQ